jgi:hypothetical protein
MLDEGRRLAADWDLYLRLAQYYPTQYIPFTAATRRMHSGSEDTRDVEGVLRAIIDVMDCFFRRQDLTNEQRKLRNRGTAVSRLNLAAFYQWAGKRPQAKKTLLEAAKISPPMLFTTRLGRHALLRLMIPFNLK